jgi:hypothetical protein
MAAFDELEFTIAQVVTKKVNYIEDTLRIVYVHIHCVDRNIQRKWNSLFFKNVQGAITRTDPNINCTSSHVCTLCTKLHLPAPMIKSQKFLEAS